MRDLICEAKFANYCCKVQCCDMRYIKSMMNVLKSKPTVQTDWRGIFRRPYRGHSVQVGDICDGDSVSLDMRVLRSEAHE